MITTKRLTVLQVEKLEGLAEKCLVHPYNVSADTMSKKDREKFRNDYENTLADFYNTISPQVVLSLVQQIIGRNSNNEFDLHGELI